MNNYYRIIAIIIFVIVASFSHIALADTFLDTVNEKVNESKDTKNDKEKKDKKEHHDDDDHHHSSSYNDSDGFMSIIFRGIFFSSDIPHRIGVGYSSFSIPVANATAMSGWYFDWSPVYVEPISISIQGYFLTGSVGTIPLTLTPVVIEGQYHGALTSDAGFYAGIGYSGTSGSVGGTATQGDSGWVFDAGLEYKITPYFIASVGYKNIGIAGGNLNGINGGLSLVF